MSAGSFKTIRLQIYGIDRLARTYLQQLCADIGCSLEDLSGETNNWGGWKERERERERERENQGNPC